MREFHSIHLVKGEDLNHHGTLFAARSAYWLVESAFAAAAATHGDSDEILCRNIHGMSFSVPVRKGDVINFTSCLVRTGKTSLTASVTVQSELTGLKQVQGFITFVVVDRLTGQKKNHGIVLDEAADEEERRLRMEAERLFSDPHRAG